MSLDDCTFSSTHHTFIVSPWGAGPTAVKVTQLDDDEAIVLLLRDKTEVRQFAEMLIAVSAGTATKEPEVREGDWVLRLVCCDREDGYQVCATPAHAEAFRDGYLDAEGHARVAILGRLAEPARRGFHEELPGPLQESVTSDSEAS